MFGSKLQQVCRSHLPPLHPVASIAAVGWVGVLGEGGGRDSHLFQLDEELLLLHFRRPTIAAALLQVKDFHGWLVRTGHSILRGTAALLVRQGRHGQGSGVPCCTLQLKDQFLVFLLLGLLHSLKQADRHTQNNISPLCIKEQHDSNKRILETQQFTP